MLAAHVLALSFSPAPLVTAPATAPCTPPSRIVVPSFSTPPFSYTPIAPSLVAAPALGNLCGRASASLPRAVGISVAGAIILAVTFLKTNFLTILGNWLLNTADKLEQLKASVQGRCATELGQQREWVASEWVA